MKMKTKTLTYRDVINKGWTVSDTSKTRKYISRKIDPYNQPVMIAAGRRKNQYYVEIPYWSSTRYSMRVYLRPPQV
jgi:hypothetical protein